MTYSAPLVSVIIVNFNGEGFLVPCLDSVLNNRYPNFEVVFVDNASTDSSLQIVQKRFGADPRLKIIKNKANYGFSGGNNVGFKHCCGQYVAFLNSDTVVDEEWLTALVDALQRDSTIGLAQSTVLMMDSDAIQTAGWVYSDYLVRKHALGKGRSGQKSFQSTFEVSVASGASMITKRSLITEVGLFDARVPFFYDDTLLSFKVWLANKRVVTVSKSKIHHILGASSKNEQKKTLSLFKANTCLLFDVYYRLDELAFAIFINSFRMLIDSTFCLKKKNLYVVHANMEGMLWALRNFRFLWSNRLRHWSKTKISPQTLKEKFIRVSLPVASYLFPSKLNDIRFEFAVHKYEAAVEKPAVISKIDICVLEQESKYIGSGLIAAVKS
ncbi:MAG: glycosyltransferase family 2 protein [Candidatus Bathyarchaeota archaeon]|nr:glycosyltransferase family 2 protein [Candidatus Bathyarchaeota archaeon]